MSDRVLNLTEVITACRQGRQLPPHVLLGLASAEATPAVAREAFEKRATMVREMLADVASASLRERLLRQLSVARQIVIANASKSRTTTSSSEKKNDSDDLHFAEIEEPLKNAVQPKSVPPAVPSRSKMPPVPTAPVNSNQQDDPRHVAILRGIVVAPIIVLLLLVIIQPWRSANFVSQSAGSPDIPASTSKTDSAAQIPAIPGVQLPKSDFAAPILSSSTKDTKNPEISSQANEMDAGDSVFDGPLPFDLGKKPIEVKPAETAPPRVPGAPKASAAPLSPPTTDIGNILPEVCHLRPPGSPPQQFLLTSSIEASQVLSSITLELDDSVADLSGRYHLQLEKKAGEDDNWQVFLRKKAVVDGTAKSTLLTEQGFDIDSPLAEFQLTNASLDFRWLPGAKPKIARQLCNCLLRLNGGESSQAVPLRKVENIPEIATPGKGSSYSLDWLHRDSVPCEDNLFVTVSFHSPSDNTGFSDVLFPANKTVVIPLTRIDSLEAVLKNEDDVWKLRLHRVNDSAMLKFASNRFEVAKDRFQLRPNSSTSEKEWLEARAELEELRELVSTVSGTKLRVRIFASLDGGRTEFLTLGAYK